MRNDLALLGSGMLEPSKPDRQLAARARDIHDRTQLAGYQAQGGYALAANLMDGMVQLDTRRRILSRGDETLDRILGEIELEALRQAKLIQTSYMRGF